MEFFNKKEEVLEVTLTQKGREKYAAGEFKPAYYSFHDSDVTYESKFSESQNDIVPRIKDTPTLKQSTSAHNNISDTTVILHPEKLYSEIGNKALSDQYKPAWQLDFIKSPSFQYVGNRNAPLISTHYEVKMSSSIDNNNANQDIIPQIDIQTIYQVAVKKQIEDGFYTHPKNEYYLIKDDPIIVGVEEYNSFENYEKQEYEIEAYYKKDKDSLELLSFNPELLNSIYKYINILTDNLADFEERVGTKDIYGDLTERDDSNC